ncbi:hypothetical protein [Inhella crocodyli]|uniref:Uncharacterized protein n=1 Tax=Inhella crocodyli TaxID=2499851 RepID=A0A437LR52_9BURK|nr:hypothetical protein [Inhella crocodyli]RVT87885.1 hypothetical protein EOD73_02380 [Inhella crocodyli]
MTHTPASHLAVAALALALAGCSSTGQQVGQAATTPLRDLNLVNAPIPELLQATQKAPYAMPGDRSCPALAAAVAELDAVLGPDLDAPKGDKPSLGDRGQAEAGKALQRAAEGAVPFRGWIRKLSGAERYSRQVEAAIQAGEARRAYLRGIATGQSC